MPRIVWENLPSRLIDHLFERAAQRGVTDARAAQDLARLMKWRKSNPEAPEGKWYKEFGTFTLCGEGAYPKTFLEPGQAPDGKKIG
jgi:hypothetical protein